MKSPASKGAVALLAFALVLVLTGPPAAASDWPQFRGPSRHGISAEPDLAATWENAPPRELWRHQIGSGFSAVSAVGDRLYTMTSKNGEEVVLCLDAATGKALWSFYIGEPQPSEFGDGPRSTPTVQDGVVYTVSSKSRLVALDARDGAPLWQQELSQWGTDPRFGYATSPLVEGDLVVVEIGSEPQGPEASQEAGVAAFDRKSGQMVWSALEAPAAYSSPIVVDLAGTRQLVFSRRFEIAGVSLEGKELWRYPTERRAAIPVPVFLPPDRLFISTSDDSFGGVVLHVTHGENGFQVEPGWTERRMRNHFNTSVKVGGYLYGFDNATLKCLDAETGELAWAQRGFGKGSLISSGDLLFVLSDNGVLALVKATPEGFQEAGRVQAMKGKAWTSPSLAEGRIYLRDLDEIVAYDVRAPRLAEGAGAAATGGGR